MDSQSQLVRSQFHDQHGHEGDHDHHHSHHTAGEGEHEHGKKSVLKKVKAKAKKLKDTLTKHGHGHDHDVIPDDHDLDEEEDDEEDEEMVHDPEVHGAPIYDSAGRRAAPVRMGNTGHSGGNMGQTTGTTTVTGVIRESPHVPCTSLPLQQHEILAQPPATLIEVQPEDRRSHKYDPSPAAAMGTGYNHHPKHTTASPTDPSKTLLYGQECQTKVNLGRPIGGLEEDPAAPNAVHYPSNYQTKVTDPTRAGAEEVGVTPILASFGKMSVYDEATEDRSSPRERLLDQDLHVRPHQTQHDQYSSTVSPITTGAGAGLGTGSHDQFSPEPRSPKRHDQYSNLPFTGTGSHDQFSPEPRSPKRHDHYSNLPISGTGAHNLFSSEAHQNLHVHHRDHDSEPILPVTGTPASHDSIHRTEGEYSDLPTLHEGRNQPSDMPLSGGGFGTFEPEKALPRESSVPLEYSRQMPEDMDRASDGSTYTEKISSASSAVMDKAVSAKNAVASKLGYGGNNQQGEGDANKPITASATEYGKKIVDKLSPVYEKVAGAGSAVMSKMPGTGSAGTVGEEGQDKGVSVREYISEKLRPGEEDRALSEVISETLHRRKEETGKREEEPMGAEELEKVAERVTESEEVKRRLGTGEERAGQKVAESYVNSPGSSVVDKLRGAVGGWFGIADPIQDQNQQQSSTGNGGTNSSIDRETRAGE